MDVSRETEAQLAALSELVIRWTRRINLIAPSTIAHIRERHIEDSLQISDHVSGPMHVDLGSGGGFPGLVIAIARPELRVRLIEADRRKCEFLRTAARQIGLANVAVEHSRIEDAEPSDASSISARALAPLQALIPLALRHGTSETRFIFPKGAQHPAEIRDAREDWDFHIDVVPSSTDNSGVILILENIKGVGR